MDRNLNKHSLPNHFNEFGEAPLDNAPVASLENGKKAIPQQFFYYQRTVGNIEKIISLIEFSVDLPIFALEENGHVYLQVGIIGHENYPVKNTSDSISTAVLQNEKIVYGRRWYIEPYTPTSEVIQTAFLAINKVREHEVRELFAMSITHHGKKHRSTPFNSHVDLPLAAKNRELFTVHEELQTCDDFENSLKDKLTQLSLGHCKLQLEQITFIDKSNYLCVMSITEATGNDSRAQFMKRFFPELIGENITFITSPCISQCLHALINAVIKQCEVYTAEHFTFNHFNRFHHRINPDDLAKFSLDTRLVNEQRTPEFNEKFTELVRLVDSGKAPKMAKLNELSQKQTSALQDRKNLEGYLPK